jgi:hypothetical protein
LAFSFSAKEARALIASDRYLRVLDKIGEGVGGPRRVALVNERCSGVDEDGVGDHIVDGVNLTGSNDFFSFEQSIFIDSASTAAACKVSLPLISSARINSGEISGLLSVLNQFRGSSVMSRMRIGTINSDSGFPNLSLSLVAFKSTASSHNIEIRSFLCVDRAI